MAPLSIVVPLLPGETLPFEDTLASILRSLPDGAQLLAVHCGSYQDAHDLASVGVELVQARQGESHVELLIAALSRCRAAVVHVLRPGMLVEEGWTDAALPLFADPQVGGVTPLIVDERDTERVVACGIACTAGYRARLVGHGARRSWLAARLPTPLAPSSWAAYYRRTTLQSILSTLPRIDAETWDLEVGLSFKAGGWLNVVDSRSSLVVEDPRALVQSYSRVHGRQTQRLAWRHGAGSSLAAVFATLRDAAQEMVLGLLKPRQFAHGVQRLAALPSVRHRRAAQRKRQGMAQASPVLQTDGRRTRTAA